MVEKLWEDFDSDEIQIRDRWQFALKSEFFPDEKLVHDQCVQEFYFFVPNSLQINRHTYTKAQFYHNLTSLIRYKTPEFSFAELFDCNSHRSPLTNVFKLCSSSQTNENVERLSDELKLLANVVRSSLRREVRHLIALGPENIDFAENAQKLLHNLKQLQTQLTEAEEQFKVHWSHSLLAAHWVYIDEFISEAISHYIVALLQALRQAPQTKELAVLDESLSQLLVEEKKRHDRFISYGKTSSDRKEENIVYRIGLLNKFVLNALQLSTNRFSIDQRFQHWVGAFSAAIAMLLYFTLFIWLGNVFLLNSLPFVVLTVIIYVLKDRIKEWLRTASFQHASHWFPDYLTKIKTLHHKSDLGVIQESFSFIEQDQLPKELIKLRNLEFHAILETFERPENILFYKRIIKINKKPHTHHLRRRGLNIIFRFNLRDFLEKARNPYETHVTIDPASKELVPLRLPKVYHINLIIRTSFLQRKTKIVKLKKLRLIVDKNGIKRIESL